MIDLHCHILPGIDDGSSSLEESLEMARMMAAEGVGVVACTPHITPGVFNNDGWSIRGQVARLQEILDQAGVAIHLVCGADVHLTPNLAAGLRSGALLSLHDTRFVLIEPPHHVLPPRLDEVFFDLLSAGYVPVLTHPERLSWVDRRYDLVRRLVDNGVWMQITAGALLGDFGRKPQYWAERMLVEGQCHIMATDAHNVKHRPPRLRAGFERAATLVGEEEAINLVLRRPYGILEDRAASEMSAPSGGVAPSRASKPKKLWSRILTKAGIVR